MQIEHVKVGEDGRVVIPVTMRKETGIRPGDTVVIESDGDSLLVRSYERSLAEAQEAFAPHRTPAGVVDELIRERRDEAGQTDGGPA